MASNDKQITIKEVQIYCQYIWHDDAYIVGNRDGLIALRDAVDTALSDSGIGQAKAELSVSDGEGYDVFIINAGNMEALILPYEANYATGYRHNVRPRDLLQLRDRDIDNEHKPTP